MPLRNMPRTPTNETRHTLTTPIQRATSAFHNKYKQPLTNPAALLTPCPDEWMEVIQVGAAVGNVKKDGPELILPVS